MPKLQVGYLSSFFAPLSFVLALTIGKEGLDDYKRYTRDLEANGAVYTRLSPQPETAATGGSEHLATACASLSPLQENTEQPVNLADSISPSFSPHGHDHERVASSQLRVGDVVCIEKNQKVPADCLLLHSDEGGCFIRTDQLDGETDWKLRIPVPSTQRMSLQQLLGCSASVFAEAPSADIHAFVGNFTLITDAGGSRVDPLTHENCLWMNTVVASSPIVAVVIYTGRDTKGTPPSLTHLVIIRVSIIQKEFICLQSYAHQ